MMTQISVISESLKDIACSPFCGALLANEIENEIESGEYRAERNADDKATDYHDDNRCFHPLRHQAEVFESRHLNARGIRGAWLISAVLCLCSNLHALRVKATRIFWTPHFGCVVLLWVALARVRVLLLCAKHLFIAANVALSGSRESRPVAWPSLMVATSNEPAGGGRFLLEGPKVAAPWRFLGGYA